MQYYAAFHLSFHCSQKFSFSVSEYKGLINVINGFFFWSYKVDSALSQENSCWELAFRIKKDRDKIKLSQEYI